MSDTIYYIPIYKTCPDCNGAGGVPILPESDTYTRCHTCEQGVVRVLIPLDEFAKEIDLSEEATHNLMCCVRDA